MGVYIAVIPLVRTLWIASVGWWRVSNIVSSFISNNLQQLLANLSKLCGQIVNPLVLGINFGLYGNNLITHGRFDGER